MQAHCFSAPVIIENVLSMHGVERFLALGHLHRLEVVLNDAV